jgi:hypothetical protein
MDLGDAVLTLTVDESGLVTGFAKAKGDTDKFVGDTKDQTTSFKDMWGGAMAALSAAGVLMAIKGIQQIIAVGQEMLTAFAEDERALMTMALAFSTNKNVTDQAAAAMHNWAQELQTTTIFTNDQIEAGLVLLSGMDMTTDRMKEVMTAAMNLSSVYGIDLEQAVRGLAMSLEAGTVGMLSRQIPAFRAMTEEQLKGGAAIDWVATRYSAGSELIGNTTAGLQIRMKNLIDEQKEKIGEVIAVSYQGISDLSESIDKIGTIAAKVVDIFIRSLITLGQWFKFSYDAFVGFFKLVTDLAIDVGRVIWAPIEYAFHGTIQAIKGAFVGVLNWIIDQAEGLLRTIGNALSKVTAGVLGGALKNIDLGDITFISEKVKPLGETLKKIFEDAKSSASAYGELIRTDAESIVSTWTAKAPVLADKLKTVQAAVKDLSTEVTDYEQKQREYQSAWDLYTAAAIRDEALKAAAVKAAAKEIDDTIKASEAAKVKATENAEKKIQEARKASEDAEKARLERITSLTISSFKEIFESTATALVQGALTWKSFGETVLKVLGKIISTMGDELAASAAADVVKAIAALASIVGAAAAPGFFASAAIKSVGAAAAWVSGAALQAVKLKEGGEFTVPPGYENDSFPMRVESGERVSVTPAGEEGGDMIHVVVNLDSWPILDAVTRGSRNRQVLISARSVVP